MRGMGGGPCDLPWPPNVATNKLLPHEAPGAAQRYFETPGGAFRSTQRSSHFSLGEALRGTRRLSHIFDEALRATQRLSHFSWWSVPSYTTIISKTLVSFSSLFCLFWLPFCCFLFLFVFDSVFCFDIVFFVFLLFGEALRATQQSFRSLLLLAQFVFFPPSFFLCFFCFCWAASAAISWHIRKS